MPDDLLLRPMTPEDIPAVAAIERLCFAVPWPEDAFISEFSNACARYVVLCRAGDVVAYGGMWLIIDEAHINNIAVAPTFQGLGYGRRVLKGLMRLAFREASISQMTLEVRVNNEPALALYTSLGFVTEGRRKGYYENGEDAYIMWCRNTLEQLI
ncbi:MAG: ribosomal protein S18-alanine N-acetyltransferase [Eubacteriales bacterium]|nr:ribosomal protein S18-alanine N-acetyltransferase [Eubacteriales bacterium]